MTLILQISDTHFGTEQPAVAEALVKLANEQSPQVLVLSGDVTQRARQSQFRAAKRLIGRLAVPATLILPGNHDIPLFNLPARLFCPYGNFQKAFGMVLEPRLESPDLLLLCVKTTRRYRHKDGEISADQLQRVARSLSRATDDQLRVVVTHQSVMVDARATENPLYGAARAVRAWAEAGVDLLLSGHIHIPIVRSLRGDFGGISRNVWMVQGGTALSSRVRHGAGNSVHLIRYDPAARPRRCSIERWDYQPGSSAFGVCAVTEALLDRGQKEA